MTSHVSCETLLHSLFQATVTILSTTDHLVTVILAAAACEFVAETCLVYILNLLDQIYPYYYSATARGTF